MTLRWDLNNKEKNMTLAKKLSIQNRNSLIYCLTACRPRANFAVMHQLVHGMLP